jgi:HPt (histidine-containing phosphotransfer) domain-containing protein
MLLGVSTLRNDGTALAEVLDIEGTLARFGGDRQLFVEMTTFLLEDAPPLVANVRSALAAGDAKALEGGAHALKGLLINSGGIRAANAANNLEVAAHARELGDADGLLRALEAELDALTKAIRAYQ